MTLTLDPAPILADASVLAGARAIAEAFGLGDTAHPSSDWPIDDGDAVLAIEIEDAGLLLLAVNRDVAGRLASNPDRLRQGFAAALDAIVGVSSAPGLRLGELVTTDVRPRRSAEIFDGKRMCALFGVALADPAGPTSDDVVAPDVAGSPVSARRAVSDGAMTNAGTTSAGTSDAGAPGGPGAAAPVFRPDVLAAGDPMFPPHSGPLSLLQDVEMDVTVELGRTRMPIRELLALQPGMVVELDHQAGAPIDVLINGRLIAYGEVVVIDEEFGIRITEIVDRGNRP